MAGNKRKTEKVTGGDGDVTFDLSLLSLSDRSRLSAMAHLDDDPGVRALVLGLLGEAESPRGSRPAVRQVPERWTVIHVLDRLEEAFEVLASLPMATRPKAYGNAMPTVVQQRFSLLDQFEMQETGELAELHQDRNRVRLSVSAAQISRMDQAFSWPVTYLKPYPEVAKAVCLKAWWSVSKADIGRRCAARRMNPKFFNRQWQHGLAVIATQLVLSKIPVS
jgi:hypothetical protein